MLTRIFNREPIVVLAFADALIALFVAFGVDISTGQKAAVDAVVAAVFAFAGRAVVTPVADPRV